MDVNTNMVIRQQSLKIDSGIYFFNVIFLKFNMQRETIRGMFHLKNGGVSKTKHGYWAVIIGTTFYNF
jgi:hypothetical protein